MSVSKFNRAKVGTKDELEEIANKSHQRIFIGTRDAAELAIQNGEIGDSSVVYITDDYDEEAISYNGIIIGTVLRYAGATAPKNYLLCDGSTFDTTQYPELFRLLGKDTTPVIEDTSTEIINIIKAK